MSKDSIDLEYLLKERAADVRFLLKRLPTGQVRSGERFTGISSNSLVRYAFGGGKPDFPGEYPFDIPDLNACERTWRMLPKHRRVRKVERLLEKYREHVSKRWPGYLQKWDGTWLKTEPVDEDDVDFDLSEPDGVEAA